MGRLRKLVGLVTLLVALTVGVLPMSAQGLTCTFRNPILDAGQDPSVVVNDGAYYLVQSNGTATGITIRRSETLTGLGDAEMVTIFAPPPGEPYSHDIWAPEVAVIDNVWYVYFAATVAPGDNDTHRTFVLRADDPMGTWELVGPVFQTPELDKWAIDLAPFEWNEQLYAVWSGTGDPELSGAAFPQVLYIAAMDDPTTITGERVLLNLPDEPWETSRAAIAEGPQPYLHDGTLSIVYSGDASWTRAYKLAILHLTGDDPLDPESWTKIGPVFAERETEAGNVYGPGHNSSPFPSPDGSEWWHAYHAKRGADDTWADRDVRLQRITWDENGLPVFGDPIPSEQAQALPAGEECGVSATFSFDEAIADDAGNELVVTGEPTLVEGRAGQAVALNEGDVLETAVPLVEARGSYTVAAWVRVDELGDGGTLLSQEGGIFSVFMLRLDESGAFAFSANTFMGETISAIASEAAPLGEWVHLAGVRDAVAGELRLYVNGELSASTAFNDAWRAAGPFVIGAAKARGQRADFIAAVVDDIQVYNGALDDAGIAALAE